MDPALPNYSEICMLKVKSEKLFAHLMILINILCTDINFDIERKN